MSVPQTGLLSRHRAATSIVATSRRLLLRSNQLVCPQAASLWLRFPLPLRRNRRGRRSYCVASNLATVAFLTGLCVPLFAGPEPSAPKMIQDGWTDAIPAKEIVPEYIGDDLELAVIPTPKKVVYSGKLLAVGKTAVVIPKEYPHSSTLRDLKALFPDVESVSADEWKDDPTVELLVTIGEASRSPVSKGIIEALGAAIDEEGRKALGPEGYLLFATKNPKGQTVVVLAGNSPTGDFWAVQTLKQLLVKESEKSYINGVWMLDWPSFPRRGSKEMRNYLPECKDNFSWGGRPGKRMTPLVENFGTYIPYFAPGGTLDCSEESLAKLEKQFASNYKNGAREFAIKFDDVGSGLTPETKDRFDSYGEAISYFMRELDKRAKKLDPKCKLYYLPQCYYSNSNFRTFGKAIRDAGGLPEDAGLCWTGTGVFSPTLPIKDIKEYMEAFGLTRTKGLIYDNHARHSDFFPIPIKGRSPGLVQYLDGVFSESSTRLNRITRTDYNWNPEAYDPVRAHKLACREVAGRNPSTYKAIYEFVSFYEANRTIPPGLPRLEKIKRLKQDNAKLKELLVPLQGALPAKDKMLASLSKAVDVRLKKEARLISAGFREAKAIRAAAPPTLDGKLDDPCWKDAPILTDFVNWDQEKWTSLRPQMAAPIPAERQTIARVAYDDSNLYMAIVFKSDVPFTTLKENGSPFWWAKRKQEGPDLRGIWHGPSVEIFLAPNNSRQTYYQLVAGILETRFDQSSGQPPSFWDSGWQTKVQRTEKEWTLEASIPLAPFGIKQIKKGDIWGLNLCRTAPARDMWTFVWGPGGFHTPEDFGLLFFE